MSDNKLMTKQEVAEAFQVEKRTVERWARAGAIPYVKFGRLIRFRWKDIDERLDRKVVGK